MTHRLHHLFAVLLCFGLSALVLGASPSKPSPKPVATLVLKNANVITVDPSLPRAQAVAVRGGRILAVGSNASIQKYIRAKTKVLDLKGATVVPGWIEGHGHLTGLGMSRMRLNLSEAKSAEDVIRMVQQRVKQLPPGTWIVGRGWDQNKWPSQRFPHHSKLSTISPKHPVYLSRVDGHAAWVNQKAMTLAGIHSKSKAPKGGAILKDGKGQPTGILVDAAMGPVYKQIPPPSRAYRKKAMELAIQESHAAGITSFHDAGVSGNTVSLYKELLREGKLTLRMYVMISAGDTALVKASLARGPEIGLGDGHLTLRSLKLMADGALGSRGAALLEPYSDKPKQTGLLRMSEQQIYKLSVRAIRKGFQVNTHAIGDRTNRVVLNAYERAFRTTQPDASPRFRIEHAQILDAKDIPRFGKLGVIASMQPTHCTSDMPWVPRRIGAKRTQEGAYVWQSLLRSGARIVSGSDAPVESVRPLWGYYAAVTRQNHDGKPTQGWNPSERMTRMQALRSYTIDAAYGAFEEHQKGSISVGKLADFTVLSHDITKIPAKQILQTQVLRTIVHGKVLFQQRYEAGRSDLPTSRPTSHHHHHHHH
ncbi:MAG: amidohydrolase [Deltaproteobacteria bacterium]|nr:MAG: amidohydrolase [Deltaproteobacteria bacterium]